MRKLRKGILAAILAALPTVAPVASAQTPPISDSLSITAGKTWTWEDNQTAIAQFDSPIQIQLDNVKMSADSAVMWITPVIQGVTEIQQVEIALIGNARLEQASAKRTSDRLFVTATVRGSVRINADDRLFRDCSQASLYQAAAAMRDESGLNIRSESGHWRLPSPTPLAERPTTPALATIPVVETTTVVSVSPCKFQNQKMPDGTMAFVIDKGFTVTIRHVPDRKKYPDRQAHPDQVTQLIADRGVIFTTLTHFAALNSLEELNSDQGTVQSLYLEGDVRVLFTPNSERRPDVALEANQVFYEIATDRAVLTDAVMHTMDPSNRVPVIIRAKTLKQLSRSNDENQRRAEYRAEKSLLTTSSFATPTYAIAADRAYIKQYDTGDEYYGMRTDYSGRNSTLDFWGTPVIWMPYSGGSLTERGFPLRAFDIGSDSRFGFFTRTEWGFFETIGRRPPKDLDLSYRVDYLANRGPGGGVDGTYSGSFFTDNTNAPWSYDGKLETYFIYDRGADKFGADRNEVPADVRDQDSRGRIFWEHQQFLPDDWQVQMRYAYLSDPAFLEEYYPDKYHGIEPEDTSFYIKHQRDTEALTLLASTQPNHFVTTQEYAAEKFEVKRMPELGYYRLGDSFGDDAFTFFSANTVSRLGFVGMGENDTKKLGYPFEAGEHYPEGIPAEGWTGRTSKDVDRADMRQEVAYPVTIDKFRVMPYVMGRYTGYSDSPKKEFVNGQWVTKSSDDSVNRGIAGGGLRMTTEFWRVDDYAQSDLWDLHRVRHVIEPELNVFGMVGGTKPNDVYIFDEPVDDASAISGTQIALHQRWQTKRGVPDKMQSVDFLSWNIEGNFFFAKPDDPTYIGPDGLPRPLGRNDPDPSNFRGLFFPSAPEQSLARNSVNSDQAWRISDSTAILADQEENLDAGQMATESVGMAVRRGDRLTYYVGDRYINELNSNIVSFLANYELSTKYALGFGQSYDFGSNDSVSSSFSIIRRFDRFYVATSVNVDNTTGASGFYISIRPSDMPSGISAQNLPSAFSR